MIVIDKELSLYDACANYLARLVSAAIEDSDEVASSANDPCFASAHEPLPLQLFVHAATLRGLACNRTQVLLYEVERS